jgi:hypothetical protein
MDNDSVHFDPGMLAETLLLVMDVKGYLPMMAVAFPGGVDLSFILRFVRGEFFLSV